MAGRKPKPTAVRVLEGNPGKRALNASEPIAVGTPLMPDSLTPEAARAWGRVVPVLEKMGVLQLSDELALERLCLSYSEILDCNSIIEQMGYVYEVQTKEGETLIKANPAVSMRADAARRFASMLVEFGMTPSARSRLSVGDGSSLKDPLDDYL